MKQFRLIISTPSGDVLDGEVTALYLRTTLGDMAVLPGHAPLVTGIRPCICRVDDQNSSRQFSLDSGMLAVKKECTTILCSQAKEVFADED